MAQEIGAVELLAEALAGGERGLEIGLAEYIRVAAPRSSSGSRASGGLPPPPSPKVAPLAALPPPLPLALRGTI